MQRTQLLEELEYQIWSVESGVYRGFEAANPTGSQFLKLKIPAGMDTLVKTNSSQEKQFARMSGNTLQIKNVIKNDAGKETIYMTNGISGPK
ncbi:hypothetical protein [Bacillus mojavensis]|uniref:hypothetical protein n=1 Tax=Bacillus mojavensis TaxID=72360 RepID=UPI002DC0280D|nr:hypothetical protein [Bacillus mojavensis]